MDGPFTSLRVGSITACQPRWDVVIQSIYLLGLFTSLGLVIHVQSSGIQEYGCECLDSFAVSNLKSHDLSARGPSVKL